MKRFIPAFLAIMLCLSLFAFPVCGDEAVEGFRDVRENSWYAPYVQWAVRYAITAGTSNNTFSPNETCKTSQIITFLWRAKGSEKADITNPFTDIKADAYYYNAALWAFKNGLVSGNTFNADAPCTRAMLVNWLWKLHGEPSAQKSEFEDVKQDSWYANAVDWATETGITKGTSASTFSPDATCTRAECIAFLFRDEAPHLDAYKAFLKNDAYKQYTENWAEVIWDYDPSSYAFCDIDQNGIPELLINSEPMDIFSYTGVFSYNAEDHGVTYISSVFHAYDLKYSKTHRAIAYSEMRSSDYSHETMFYKLERNKLVFAFSCGRDAYESETRYHISRSNTPREYISASEYRTIQDEMALLSFAKLDTPIVEKSKKPDLIKYVGEPLSKCVADFPDLQANYPGIYGDNIIITANVPEGNTDSSNPVEIIGIYGDSEFCVAGVEVGMYYDEAKAILLDQSAVMVEKGVFWLPGIKGRYPHSKLYLTVDKTTEMISEIRFNVI